MQYRPAGVPNLKQLRWRLTEIVDHTLDCPTLTGVSDGVQIDGAFVSAMIEDVEGFNGCLTALWQKLKKRF